MKTEKNTFSVLFILKRNKEKKNGKAPIHGRITVNGETTQFNTKLEILPDLWGSGVAYQRNSLKKDASSCVIRMPVATKDQSRKYVEVTSEADERLNTPCNHMESLAKK